MLKGLMKAIIQNRDGLSHSKKRTENIFSQGLLRLQAQPSPAFIPSSPFQKKANPFL
jgi:hypothetical protein